MAIDFNVFSSPDFQNKWAYSDRSQQALGLNDEMYNYLKSSNFQPYQPTVDTNIQKIDGNWMNTVVQPGQTPKQFQPAPALPTTGPQTAYGANIAQTLPGGTSSILPPKAPAQSSPTQPTIGSGGGFGDINDPKNWGRFQGGTAPTPTGLAAAVSQAPQSATAMSSRGGLYDAIRGGSPSSAPMQTAGLAGAMDTQANPLQTGVIDDVGPGYTAAPPQGANPTTSPTPAFTPTPSSNWPDGWGDESQYTPEQRAEIRRLGALLKPMGGSSTPPATTNPRDSRYNTETARTAQGTNDSLARSTALQNVMASAPTFGNDTPTPGTPGGGGLPTGGTSPGMAGGSTPGAPSTGLGYNPNNFFPDDSQSRFDNGLGLPHTSIRPEDVQLDPGYQWQQEQLNRQLEDMFAAKGRVGSTDYFNTKANSQQKLISDEYNRINNQQWDRGMEMNRLLYDRRVQEDYTQYEREYRENERKYGRDKAEEILAYERAFREDAREYDRYRYLVELGFKATESSSGT